MDPRQQETLVQRLVANPHDHAAITEAHSAGQADPEAYARLLEKVGLATPDPTLAAHWLNEAASVWLTTFNDPERAASVLMAAVERDPVADAPAHRLVQLYRTSGEFRAMMSAYERRAAALAQRTRQDPALRAKAAQLYEELGRQYAEPPLADGARSRDSLAKAVALDPGNQLAIYTLREAYKAAGEASHALPYFPLEQALEQNPARKLALFRDEAEVAKAAGDRPRAFAALKQARGLDPAEPTLKAQAASLVLETYRMGLKPSDEDRAEAGRMFVELSESYPGEHGFLYALCSLELIPGDDRAVQLAMYYGEQLQRLPEVSALAAGYLAANPNGVMAAQARAVAGDARPPLPPPPPAVANQARPGVTSDSTLARAASGSVAARHPEVAARAGFAGEDVRAAHAAEGQHGANDSLDDLLEQADVMARKSRKNEAIALYRRVLALEPTNSDALAYLIEQLPLKRKFAELRDVLLQAVGSAEASDEERVRWLREVSDLCENQLRDYDGAVNALRHVVQLEPSASGVLDHLRRLLERARRWDDLAELLTNEAARVEDLETRISLERNLAKLHITQRKDPVSAGMAWARIAELSAGDEDALHEALRLFEGAGRPDLAAHSIATNVNAITDKVAKREFYLKLGSLHAASGHVLEAAEALSEGATALDDVEMWDEAEQHFVAGQAWEQAANATDEQVRLVEAKPRQAELLARAAGYFERLGETEEAVARLERAVELVPTEESFAATLERLLVAAGRVGELSAMFISRAERMNDVAVRVGLRKRAAKIQEEHLRDAAAVRGTYLLVLRDGEDADALSWLADEAEERKDLEAAADYLARLAKTVQAPERAEHLLREGRMRARGLSDVRAAIARFHAVLEVDAKNQEAMGEIADLEQGRGNWAEAAQMLERHLSVAVERELQLELSGRLADLYEQDLQQPLDAARHLRFVHDTDPDDLDSAQRLCNLAEANGEWSLVAELTVELVAVEGDEAEVSRMTRRLAEILSDKLNKGAEALTVLGTVADNGDPACREAYIALGDRLGEKAAVAQRVVAWYTPQAASDVRSDALHAAFNRFVSVNLNAEAIAVGKELAKEFGPAVQFEEGVAVPTIDLPEWASVLERIAIESKDLEGLAVAHQLMARGAEEFERAAEFVRQAEVQQQVGVALEQVLEHGEQKLDSADPSAVEPLLARLAALCTEVDAKIDLYERQVLRCHAIEDRVAALCRAAEVAAELKSLERAQQFFEVALTGGVPEEILEQIQKLVSRADSLSGSTTLRTIFAEALSAGGQGARDGGKTQSRMLCRASELALTELRDPERALTWSGDALIQYVDESTLAVVHSLASRLDDFSAAEKVVSRALGEVFDGPMVRQLLAYRADLRHTRLNNPAGAAEDLKQMHDLMPGDTEVATRLAALYEGLSNYRGIIQLYEDQILRIRETEQRAELARKIALLWQDELNEPREAADAWRRVLRFKSDNEEAKQGLARAKEAMLQARQALSKDAERESALPPEVASQGSAPQVSAPQASADATDAPLEPSEVNNAGESSEASSAESSSAESSETSAAEASEAGAAAEPNAEAETTEGGGSTEPEEVTDLDSHQEGVEWDEVTPQPSAHPQNGTPVDEWEDRTEAHIPQPSDPPINDSTRR